MERSLRLAIVWLFVQALVVSIPRSVPPATAGANGPAWPLGRFTPLTGYAPPCISGFTCRAFKVDGCTQVSLAATGVVASASPTTAPRGVLVFFSGSDGTDWWSYGAGAAGATFTRIRAAGYWLVQVEWRDSWLVSAPGEDAGSAHLACRPATVVKWVHDNLYVPLGLSPAPEQCGFCVTGNSGGSSQAAYALAFYGMDSIVDALIPTSGPGHA